MTLPFPEPTSHVASRAEVLLGYLDYFRAQVVVRVQSLSSDELRRSRLPSGWTPLQLLKHLTFVERRWLEWGFEGVDVADPWGDERDDRWYVAADETREVLIGALDARGEFTRGVVRRHDLLDVGAPGPRWEGADPPTLERVLFHLLQEYARHVGQLDIVTELADGATGE